jgi:copper(I)-binding protein
MLLYKIFLNKTPLLFLLLNIATNTWAQESITLKNAWIADAPPTSTMFAGYLTIKNNSEKTVKLLTVSSPQFKLIEVHKTEIINNIARMIEQDQLPITNHQSVEFAPGGLHLMMMGPQTPIKLNDKIKLTLTFENNITTSITAKVQKRIIK